jgi:hypothetical protein
MEKVVIADDCLEQLSHLLRVVPARVMKRQQAILILHNAVVWNARTLT